MEMLDKNAAKEFVPTFAWMEFYRMIRELSAEVKAANNKAEAGDKAADQKE